MSFATKGMKATILAGVIGVMIDEGMTVEEMKRLWSPENIEAGYRIVMRTDMKKPPESGSTAS